MDTRTTYNWHREIINRVEARLMECLESGLPSREALAREFGMGVKTMGTHFKAIHGKTIGEYYLARKMEWALALIVDKKLSVKEAAYAIGYEKVSNFVCMFKKYHGTTPGSLKHQK